VLSFRIDRPFLNTKSPAQFPQGLQSLVITGSASAAFSCQFFRIREIRFAAALLPSILSLLAVYDVVLYQRQGRRQKDVLASRTD
jgi:hypothetical protein